MKALVRLAILECDTPLPGTNAKYGSYGGCFESLLRAGAEAEGYTLESEIKVTNWQVQVRPEEYPKIDDIDAILITGSRYNSFEDVPWINKLTDFTAKCLDTGRVRVVGVCFGHQIAGRAMGAKAGRNDDGWEVAVDDIQLTSKGKEIFGKDALVSFMPKHPSHTDILWALHQMHRDIVYFYPPGVEELGSSPVCKVQGMYTRKRLITVQGHPEFNETIVTEILKYRHAQGIFNDEVFAGAMKRVIKPHDGVVVSRAFLKFLLDQ